MPAELARHVQEITDAVLEHHIDPPARQQMVLSGIKALYRAAGVAGPTGLGRRVSAVSTPEQLATLLEEVWPKTTAKPVAGEGARGRPARGPGRGRARRYRIDDGQGSQGRRADGGQPLCRHPHHAGHGRQGEAAHDSQRLPGGPAGRAGIKDGAIIEEIDGADTKGMKLREAVDRLRGDDGTDVTVKIRQPKETKSRTLKITRGQLPRTTIVGIGESPSDDGKLRLDVPDPIGYLKITEITASTPHELRKLAQRMESEGIRALVLDLRGIRSGGNAVHPAVLLADSLLERGAIGRVRTARGETTYQADADALFRGWPIAVLVDQDTSGTAEWLAAALQDNHRAVDRRFADSGRPPSSARRPRSFAGGGCLAAGRRGRREDDGPRRRRPMVDLDGDRLPRARRWAPPGRSRPGPCPTTPRNRRGQEAAFSPTIAFPVLRVTAARRRAKPTEKADDGYKPAEKAAVSADRPGLECRRDDPPPGPGKAMRTTLTIPAIGAVCLASLLMTLAGRALAGEPGTSGSPARRIRQPVALAVVNGGQTLLAANGRSGSLSVVDIASRKVVAEPAVGRGLADLAVLPDGRHLLAVDRAAGELLLVEYRDRSPRVVGRIAVAPDPVRVVVLGSGSSAVVASTWPRRLTFVSLAPRAPENREPALVDRRRPRPAVQPSRDGRLRGGSRLVVADAFGGRLAVVDLHRRAIESVRSLPAHNIRGMTFSPDGRTLLVTHQVLNRLAQTTFDDVHWGQLIRNHLRVLRVESLLTAGPDSALLDGGRLLDLGDVGYAAGDPGAIAFDRRGNLIVALEGMDEVAIAAGVDQGPRRVVVGRRPSAVASARMASSPTSPTRSMTRSRSSRSRPASGPRRSRWGRGPSCRRPTGASGSFPAPGLARRLDELPELPHRRAHQQPVERHAGRRLLRCAEAGAFAPGRGRDRPVDLDRLDGPAGGPGAQVDRHDHARHEADRRPGRRPDRVSRHARAALAAVWGRNGRRRGGARPGGLPLAEVRELPRAARIHDAPEVRRGAGRRGGQPRVQPPFPAGRQPSRRVLPRRPRRGRSGRSSPGNITRGDSSSRPGRSTTSWRSWGRFDRSLLGDHRFVALTRRMTQALSIRAIRTCARRSTKRP